MKMTANNEARFGSGFAGGDGGCRGVAPTELDSQETSDTRTRRPTYRDFLISGIKKDVDFAYNVYADLDLEEGTSHAATFGACKTKAWFVRHTGSGEVRVAASRCHLRWCPLCIRTKTFVITQNTAAWIVRHPKAKFITVTLKHNSASLADQVDRLYDCFRKLRRRKWFLRITKGGIWFFQIKKSKSDGNWHPHIHCLVDAEFVPQKRLSAEWLEITGDSMIVDVKAIKDPMKAAKYVARYAAAPCRLCDFDRATAVDIVRSLHGRRICGTWGTGSEIKLAPQKPDDYEDWEYLCGWSWAASNHHTDSGAKAVFRAFTTSSPLAWNPFESPPDFVLPENLWPVEYNKFAVVAAELNINSN